MKGYLGEIDASNEHTPDRIKDALLYIEMYGGIDGAHHKDWVLDQVARILNGAPVIVTRATWKDTPSELRYNVGESVEYHEWVERIRYVDGEDYGYEEGIAP